MPDDEEREDQDPALFEVHEVGPVKFYEAAKGVDWLSQFPDDPRRRQDPEPKLIDLPMAVEPPAPPASAAVPVPAPPSSIASPPRRSVDVLYPPGPKRVPRVAIAFLLAGVIASAAFLYWLVTPPTAHPPPSVSSASNSVPDPEPDRLTMDALKPNARAPSTADSALPAGVPDPTPSSATPAPRSTPTPTVSPTVTPRVTPTFTPRAIPAVPAAAASAQPARPSPAFSTPPAQSPQPPPTNAATSSATLTPSPSPSSLSSSTGSTGSSGSAGSSGSSSIVGPPAPTPRATPSASPAAPSAPPANPGAAETAAVRAVLDAYRTAYESMSSESVKSLWPGVDATALSKAFKQMDSQSMDFYSCGIELGNGNAEATCTGAVTFVPKVGGKTPRVEPHRWTFFLVRRNDRWFIDRVVAR